MIESKKRGIPLKADVKQYSHGNSASNQYL